MDNTDNKLTGPKGTVMISRKTGDLTFEDLKVMAKLVGIEETAEAVPPTVPEKEHTEAAPEQEKAKERPRKYPLLGSAGSEGFPVREMVEEKQTSHPTVKISCPECGTETTDTVPPHFKYKQCPPCGTKVFLVANDDPGVKYDRVGDRRYMTHKERIERKLEVQNRLRETLNGSDFPVTRLRETASLQGLTGYSQLRKPELVDLLIKAGVRLDAQGNPYFLDEGGA